MAGTQVTLVIQYSNNSNTLRVGNNHMLITESGKTVYSVSHTVPKLNHSVELHDIQN